MKNKIILTAVLVLTTIICFSHQTVLAATPISTCQELQEMTPLTDDFYLTQDINCSATSQVAWGDEDGKGWIPLSSFSGNLDGGDFSITNLYIDRPSTDNVGLFSSIDGGHVFDLSLTNVDITGDDYVGGLVGTVSSGGADIENVTVGGVINGDDYVGGQIGQGVSMTVNTVEFNGTVDASNYVGGLVGHVTTSNPASTFVDAETSGTVTASDYVGGLIGLDNGSSYTNCSSSSDVTGVYDNLKYVGGLIGQAASTGTITSCSASGDVEDGGSIGGLIGYQDSEVAVSKSYATGNVSNGKDNTGGLVGENYSEISDSWATGVISSTDDNVGGLVGSHYGTIARSYSTEGNITSSGDNIGGLVGLNDGTITRSYSTKNVTGGNCVGGLIGVLDSGSVSDCYAVNNVVINVGGIGGGFVGILSSGSISDSYSVGTVGGDGVAFGFAGAGPTVISTSYWDVTISGIGSSGGDNLGATGKTTTEMQTLATFSSWDISDEGSDYDSPSAWYFGDSYPELQYAPNVTTSSSNPGRISAVLSGNLQYYYGVDTSFRYRRKGTSTWVTTTPVEADEIGSFDSSISGLNTSTDYEFQAIVTYDGVSKYGSTVEFKTNPGSIRYNYQIDIDSSEGGSASGSVSTLDGSKLTISAHPNSGYIFSHWEENGVIVSTNQYYSFSASENRSLKAVFQSTEGDELKESLMTQIQSLQIQLIQLLNLLVERLQSQL
jgi:hypothetical protein